MGVRAGSEDGGWRAGFAVMGGCGGTQASILGEVRHPNVVLLMGVCLRAPNLCLLLEWCAGGSLHDLLHRSKSDISREQRLGLAAGVASAVAFLHTSSPAIIHRDIKTQNVLLDETRSLALWLSLPARAVRQAAASAHGCVLCCALLCAR